MQHTYMKNKILCAALVLVLAACGQQKETYYVKHVEFPEGATVEQKVDMASRLVPTPQQMEWQQMELSAFLHFGMNTFTGREWGDGQEDPALFNPTSLDAEQWVRVLKEAGFKIVILTAKHHDGFCLWPTATTTHSVASSPWKNGKGDVVRELRDACDKYGMKFGVYLSPWDRHAPCYGNSPEYNKYFIAQLTELLTNYGEVHEVWFDGACGEGPDGRRQEYDWEAFYQTIRKLQPNAVMAIMGDDVRWVGNEAGLGRETEWSATVLTPGIYARSAESNGRLGIDNMSADLGSRDMLAKANEAFWYPSEVDVSIRPGWFYHSEEDSRVKSLKQLSDIYFRSVGYNSVLLLNIPPDRRGLLHENDVARLKEFAAYRDKVFADDRVADGGMAWTAAPGSEHVYGLKDGSTVNVVMLQEDITRGQRMESFTVEALTDGTWQKVAQGTTIGYKRLLTFPAVKASAIKINVKESRGKAHVSRVAAFYAEPLAEDLQASGLNDIPYDGMKLVQQQPVTVDLGKAYDIAAMTYAPAGDTPHDSLAYRYTVSASTDGHIWHTVKEAGEFGNIMYNPQPQGIGFEKPFKARYVRIDARTFSGGAARVSMRELGYSVAK